MIPSYGKAQKLKEIEPYLMEKFKASEIEYFGSLPERNRSDADEDILIED